MQNKKAALIILDGVGINPSEYGNAFKQANTPYIDYLIKESPNSELTTNGELVGLPADQMGNSEVGHLNIGAGRVVEQWLLLISNQLRSKKYLENNNYINFINQDSENLHLIGLISTGGVHSHLDHLLLILNELKDKYKNIFLHLITDGRDVSPYSSIKDIKTLDKNIKDIKTLDKNIKDSNIKIASISGRFYAMDRDKRWERTKKFFNTLTQDSDSKYSNVYDYIQSQYDQDITDEFINPAFSPQASKISDNDSILLFNYRTDRMKQLITVLADDNFKEFKSDINFSKDKILTFTNYVPDLKINYLFELEDINNYLGEVLENNNLNQLRIAETEKYPHVTYFLNGGKDTVANGEDHLLIQSPKDVKTYDLKPEMSALEVTEKLLTINLEKQYNFIALNFANCDMVGHTGNLKAAIKAVETVDKCLKEVTTHLLDNNYEVIIIADHGNCEKMLNKDGSANTAHTTFKVPLIYLGNKFKTVNPGALSDIAPSILNILDIEKPVEMTGKSLLE